MKENHRAYCMQKKCAIGRFYRRTHKGVRRRKETEQHRTHCSKCGHILFWKEFAGG